MMEASRHRRPLGVTIIAVVLLIEGIFEIVAAIIAFTAAHVVHSHVRNVLGTAVGVISNAVGVIALIVAVLTLLVSYGLFTLKRWAFWTVIVVELIALADSILKFFQREPNYTSIIIGLILPVVILAYMFLDPYVRRAFRI
jgi:uncharacterized membrane protein (DUF2068 family)